MRGPALFFVPLLALSQGIYAQIAPSSGSQIQQIPPSPVPQRAIPEIRIEQGATPAIPGADSLRFPVRSLRVTGQAVYSEQELLAVSGFAPANEMSLADLRAIAANISKYYHSRGMFLAQAYLPAQDIKDGAVTIVVLEGHYGNIALRNQTNLRDSLANGIMEGLKPGDTVTIAPLEERLLLLSDMPGVNVKSTLSPGTAVGTSDLLVDLTPGRRVTGSIEADNAGNRYTGENRIGGTVNINNPFGLGDQAGFRVLTSGRGLTYGRAFYQAHVGRATIGVAYTALEYRLGKEFTALQAHGTAEIASIYGSYPLQRSRNNNVYALVQYDARTYQDKVDSTVPPTVTDKRNHVWIGSLYGNHRDRLGAGGLTTWSLAYSAGDLDIRTPAALAADAATARTNGNYGRLAFSAARLQGITDRFSLYAGINGQIASKNLDISEKMGLGGPYAVRAYPVGEAYADEGYVVNLEARYRLPAFSPSMPGQMYLVGFVDTGAVTINKNPWPAAAVPNTRHLSAAGLGLTWSDPNNFQVSAYWAHKVNGERATSVPLSVDRSNRVWLQGVKYF